MTERPILATLLEEQQEEQELAELEHRLVLGGSPDEVKRLKELQLRKHEREEQVAKERERRIEEREQRAEAREVRGEKRETLMLMLTAMSSVTAFAALAVAVATA